MTERTALIDALLPPSLPPAGFTRSASSSRFGTRSFLCLCWDIREPWPGSDGGHHLQANVRACTNEGLEMRAGAGRDPPRPVGHP